jgi:predicted flavoprotein YhiN
VETLAERGVTIAPLRSANCGFTVAWSGIFRDRFEGHPLKGIALSFGSQTVRGEAMITRSGIEGGAIYALSADLREAVASSGQATLHIALRPDLDMQELVAQLSRPRGRQSLSNFLRKAAHLSLAAIGLLQ